MVLGVFLFGGIAAAEGIQVQELEFAQSRWVVVSIDPEEAQIHLLGHNKEHRTVKQAYSYAQISGWNPVVLMNAGMFHSSGDSVGLHVEDGLEHRPVEVKKGEGNFYLLPNGIFGLTAEGSPFVVQTENFQSDGIELATQSGPLMVNEGRIHSKFNPQSTSLRIRNGVGVNHNGHVVWAISLEPVRFYDFAVLFRDELSCPNALYLDGVVSVMHTPDHVELENELKLGPILVAGELFNSKVNQKD